MYAYKRWSKWSILIGLLFGAVLVLVLVALSVLNVIPGVWAAVALTVCSVLGAAIPLLDWADLEPFSGAETVVHSRLGSVAGLATGDGRRYL